MMTEALASQLQDMHSTGGSLNALPHQQVHQHGGLATPLSIFPNHPSSGSPALNSTSSSGHITPIATHSNSPGLAGDPATDLLKEQLSKQLQLQRLQHLQNQILQQQVSCWNNLSRIQTCYDAISLSDRPYQQQWFELIRSIKDRVRWFADPRWVDAYVKCVSAPPNARSLLQHPARRCARCLSLISCHPCSCSNSRLFTPRNRM